MTNLNDKSCLFSLFFSGNTKKTHIDQDIYKAYALSEKKQLTKL